MKIKDILCSKNPFQNKKCFQKTCPLCTGSKYVEVTQGENKFHCSSNNVGYRWQCLKCAENNKVKVYEGETGRSARIRGAEHVSDIENKREKSALYKHIKNEHKDDEEVKFAMEITNNFRDALACQANEAVQIFSRPGNQLLNSKSEFNQKNQWTPTSVSQMQQLNRQTNND